MNARLPGLGLPKLTSTQPFSVARLNLPAAPDEQFFGGGRITHTLREGDRLPVYIRQYNDGETKNLSEIVCDFVNCGPVFKRASDIADAFSESDVARNIIAGVSPVLVKRLWAMYATFMQLTGVANTSESLRKKRREKTYKRSSVRLSDMSRNGLIACAEAMLLSKGWLDPMYYKTMLLSHVFQYAHKEQGGLHAMLAIEQPAGILLCDMVNPMYVQESFIALRRFEEGKFSVPTLYMVQKAEWQRLLQEGKNKPAVIALDTGSVWLKPVKQERAYLGFALQPDFGAMHKHLISLESPPAPGPETPKF